MSLCRTNGTKGLNRQLQECARACLERNNRFQWGFPFFLGNNGFSGRLQEGCVADKFCSESVNQSVHTEVNLWIDITKCGGATPL